MSAKEALLLSGPQHYDAKRPWTGHIRSAMEHLDPLGIAIVSSFLKKHGFETHWREMDPIDITSLETDIAAVGSVWISARNLDTSLAQSAIEFANKHHKPTVVGGYGPTFNPEAFADATARVHGEAEPVLDQVITDFLSDKLEPEYKPNGPFDLSQYTWPDRSIFPSPKKLFNPTRKFDQEWQRGCPNFCDFCSPTRLQQADVKNGTRHVRVRSPQDIIAEIEHLQLGPNDNLCSVDLNTSAIPRPDLVDILTFIKQNRIRLIAEGTVAPLLNDLEENGPDGSLLSLMSALDNLGGCYSFLYGVDDFDVNQVKGSKDKDLAFLQQAVETFRRFGIPLNLSVIVGLDHHSYPESFFNIAQSLQEIHPAYSFIHVATPYPGTVWGDKVYREERVFDHNALHHNHRNVVHTPMNMSADQLQQGYYWLLRQLYNPKQVLKTASKNFNRQHASSNLMLATIASGLHWGFGSYLDTLEYGAGGNINPAIQNELDAGYKTWKG